MKRIYVAGPYSANNVLDVLKNIGHGEKVCGELFQMGFAPFCPWWAKNHNGYTTDIDKAHIFTEHDKSYVIDFYNNDFTVEQFYNYSIAWLEVSDAMLVIGYWQDSKGTLEKIKIAKRLSIPIFYSIKELIEYYK